VDGERTLEIGTGIAKPMHEVMVHTGRVRITIEQTPVRNTNNDNSIVTATTTQGLSLSNDRAN